MTASGELFVTEELRDLVADELRKAGILRDETIEIDCPDEWREAWSASQYPNGGKAEIYVIRGGKRMPLGKVSWRTRFYVEGDFGDKYVAAEPIITRLECEGNAVIEEEPKPDRIFLVAQNIDYLKGKYLVSAVVIANDEKQAIDRVSDYLSEYDDIIFDEKRAKAMEIGILTSRPDPSGLGMNQAHLKTTELLALEVGEDYDL